MADAVVEDVDEKVEDQFVLVSGLMPRDPLPLGIGRREGMTEMLVDEPRTGRLGAARPDELPRRLSRAASIVLALVTTLFLAGCSLTALGSAPRDAEGRPLAPPPPTPTTCVTVTSGSTASCAPLHNSPSRRYVEQAVPELLPTRGYGSIQHVRCTDRIPPAPSGTDHPDPTGLGAATEFSHWTCVGREPEGNYLHEDVVWTPYSGYLALNAVTRDNSSALTVPRPNDPGLPNPHALEESQTPGPST